MRAKSLMVGAAMVAGLGVLAGCTSSVTGSPTVAGSGGGGATSQGGAGSQLGSQVKTVSDLSNLVGNSVEQATTVQVTMKSGIGTTTGSIKFGDPVAEKMSINTAAGTEQIVLVDNVFYMQIPGMQDLTGKPWIKADSSNQVFATMLNSIKENADPSQMIKNLEASGTLTGTDTEQLGGQSTTHYKITVDVDKMIANQTDPTMKQLLGAAKQEGLTNYPVEVWLDGHGLPVQTTINMPSLAGASGSGGVSTVTYTNWGAPVTITAPPADQVGTMPGTGG